MVNPVKIFIADILTEKEPLVPLAKLAINTPLQENKNLFTTYTYSNFNYGGVNFVNNLHTCDYILIPQGVRSNTGATKSYLDKWISLAKEFHKQVLVFTAGDYQHNVFIDEAIVFKALNYRFLKRKNEIYIPVYVEDLLGNRPLVTRHKTAKPVVGFCGWAQTEGLVQYFKLKLKNYFINAIAFLTRKREYLAYKKGISFRRRAIQILQASPLVKTNFIIRKSYSGNAQTISLTPDQARREFIENIINSDFVIAPKGDGNSSARFYEILSLGRVPILIDTEIILPLEDIVDYSKFTIRIHHTEMNKLPQIISQVYSGLDDQSFEQMQIAARSAFKNYLRYDAFFSYVFSEILNKRGS